MRRPSWLFSALFGLGLLGRPATAADLYGGGSDLEPEVRRLLTSTDAEKRRRGIEELTGLELRLTAPHLLAGLKDSDPSVRARAARALGPSVVQEAAPLFIAGLADTDAGVRSACAEALGQFGSLPPGLIGRAVMTLARALGDTQYEVRVEALRAIERLLRSRVFTLSEAQTLLGPVLLRVEDEHVAVRRTASAVLGSLSPLNLPAEMNKRVVVALLGRLSDSSREVRAEALTSLTALSSIEAAPAALRLLQDPGDEVRRLALLYLGSVAYASSVPLIVEQFESGPEPLRLAAAQALGSVARSTTPAAATRALQALIGGLARDEARPLSRQTLLQVGAAAISPLCARLSHGSPQQIEVGAVVDLLRDIGLNQAGGKPLAAPLRRLAADELLAELRRSRLPREQVVDALAALADPSSVSLLAGLLSDPDVAVRRRALSGLRQQTLLDGRALDVLWAATRDSDREVRAQATQALGELPLRTVAPRLIELLQSSDFEMRLAAAQAVVRSAQQPGPQTVDGRLPGALLVALLTAKEGKESLLELRVRRAAAQALGQLAMAAPALRGQLAADLATQLRKARTADGIPLEVVSALGNVLRDTGSSLLNEPTRKMLLDLAQVSSEPDSKEAALALDALDALGAMRDGSAAGRIARLLDQAHGHRDPLRRVRAASALGNLLESNPGDSLPPLLSALLEDSDGRVVAEAAWALGKLRRGNSANARVSAALRQALDRRDGSLGAGSTPAAVQGLDRAVRANILAALARLGQADVNDAKWLGDADSAVRANAALLLSALGTMSPGMQARLRNLVTTDEDHRVRRSAERALRGERPTGAEGRHHFLGMYQMDHDQKPLAETAYRLTLPDGLLRIGVSDRRGIAREEQLPPGSCEVELLSEAP